MCLILAGLLCNYGRDKCLTNVGKERLFMPLIAYRREAILSRVWRNRSSNGRGGETSLVFHALRFCQARSMASSIISPGLSRSRQRSDHIVIQQFRIPGYVRHNARPTTEYGLHNRHRQASALGGRMKQCSLRKISIESVTKPASSSLDRLMLVRIRSRVFTLDAFP
jgi:hypothetical protein